MKRLKRISAWLQLNHDTYLLGVLSVSYLASLVLSSDTTFQMFLIAHLSVVCGLVLYSKVTIRASIRVPSTHLIWAIAFFVNIASLILSLMRSDLIEYSLIWSVGSTFLASVRDKQLRYGMAKTRINNRRKQQVRWRSSKRAVLAEWKARLRWLAGVQHDIRQPLNALGLLLRLPNFYKSSIDPSVHERLLSCHRWLKELAENTLEATRLELREQREIQIDSISSTELCDSLHDWLSHLAHAKGLEFTIDSEEQTIQTDSSRLKRVLGNLLFNSVEHSYEGEVSLRYRRRGGVHQFTICDNGPGLSDKYLIGDEASDSFGSNLPKAGIGLYVVKRLSQEMGWNLTLQNNVGGGASFVLELADRLASSAAAKESTKKVDSKEGLATQ